MKFNMICLKFDQKLKKTKKPKLWTFEVFGVFKKPKNLGFFEAILQP